MSKSGTLSKANSEKILAKEGLFLYLYLLYLYLYPYILKK